MAGSISGLASGLDTDTIIKQLMQLEAVPQNRLKTQVKTEQNAVSILQNLNSRFAALATQADKLADSGAGSALKTSSSATGVTLTAGTTASPGSFSVTVEQTALSHQLGFAGSAALTDNVTGASTTVRLDRLDGTTLDIDSGDGTLDGLVKAINAGSADSGIKATAVKNGDGSYRLLVESTGTGAASDFTLKASDGTDLLGGATVRAGRDARVALGAGITVTSPTNTFTDITPGVSVTIAQGTAAGTVADLSITRNASDFASKVKSLVDAVNAGLTDLDAQTNYDSASKKAGALAGDAGLRGLRSNLLQAVYPDADTSMAQYGLQVDRSGKIAFDEAAFTKAYEADPEATIAAVTGTGNGDGFVGRVQRVSEAGSDKNTGIITASVQGRTTGIDRLNANITAWDTRLEMRQATLSRQFTALETALSQMTSQSNWLASQISSLGSGS